MAKFNQFAFMKELRAGFDPSEEDLGNFNLYMSLMTLSMDNRYVDHCNAMNTEHFYKLPKHIQCLAFSSLKGQNIDISWKKAKAGTTKSKTDIVEKVMRVFDLSYNEAESCIKFGTVDMDDVEDLYARLYDNDSIRFRKTRTRKKT